MQENSTYLKIFHVIQQASSNDLNKNDLAILIHDDNLGPFFYYRIDTEGNTQRYPCNISTIFDNINFCFDLSLLDREVENNCVLTTEGTNALNRRNFDFELQQLILEYLGENNISWQDIDNSITKLPLPTPSEIYNDIGPSIKEDVFRTCLYLLSQCGQDSDENILEGIILKIYQIR